MGSSRDFAISYLKAVEKKNIIYFAENNLDILDCVELKGTKTVTVHIINRDLPFEIRNDIELMFWQ